MFLFLVKMGCLRVGSVDLGSRGCGENTANKGTRLYARMISRTYISVESINVREILKILIAS